MWYKQKAKDAVVSVDGSDVRIPYHIFSFFWLLLIMMMRWYIGRLKKLSRDETVKTLILELEEEDAAKRSRADKAMEWFFRTSDKILAKISAKISAGMSIVAEWMKEKMMKLWAKGKEWWKERKARREAEAKRESVDSSVYHGVAAGDYDKYEDYDVDKERFSDDSEYDLEPENSEEMTLR